MKRGNVSALTACVDPAQQCPGYILKGFGLLEQNGKIKKIKNSMRADLVQKNNGLKSWGELFVGVFIFVQGYFH